MNKQQQELYEKLLKKVNEFCLGQAAEDVIEAIDNLVDTYEPKMPRELKPLEALENIKSYKNERYFNVTYDNGKQEHYETKTINDLFPNEFDIISKQLKALEFIKKHYSVAIYKGNYYINGEHISKEEYELLKEVLL